MKSHTISQALLVLAGSMMITACGAVEFSSEASSSKSGAVAATPDSPPSSSEVIRPEEDLQLPPSLGLGSNVWSPIYNDRWCEGDFYYDILLHGQECKINGGPLANLSGREKCNYNGRWLNTDGCPFHTCAAPKETPGTSCMGQEGSSRLYSTICSGNCCNFEWQYCNSFSK